MSKVFEEIKESLEQALALEMGFLPKYRGYVGTVAYSDEDKVFFGKVVGIRSLLSYEGTDLKKLEEDFHGAVDDYLEICKDNEVSNETPLSDSLVGVVKCTPEENLERESRNAWVNKHIRGVDGSMKLSGLPLTDEDKERIKYCLEHPESFNGVLVELIKKHRDQAYIEQIADEILLKDAEQRSAKAKEEGIEKVMADSGITEDDLEKVNLEEECIISSLTRSRTKIEELFEGYEGDYTPTEVDWSVPDKSNDLKKEADIGWIIDEDGVGHCPYCQSTTLEDEYTGKPILFKYCPECGRFLNSFGIHDVSKKQSVDADDELPIKLNLIPKVQFCPNDSDVDIVKGYILGTLKHIETYNEELRLSNEQKAELLHALELCCEDLTTLEAYQYYLKNE